AFGTKFPLKFWYPSKLHTYKPLSISTLQPRASAAARAVADVPGTNAIAAARHTDAQAKARELIIVLVNFVFILIVSFCFKFFVVLAFFWPFSLREVNYGRSLEYLAGFGCSLRRKFGGPCGLHALRTSLRRRRHGCYELRL